MTLEVRKVGIVLVSASGIEAQFADLSVTLGKNDTETRQIIERLAQFGALVRYSDHGVMTFLSAEKRKGIWEVNFRTENDLDLGEWLAKHVRKDGYYIVPSQTAEVVTWQKPISIFRHRNLDGELGDFAYVTAFGDKETAMENAAEIAAYLEKPRELSPEEQKKLGRKNKWVNGWSNLAVVSGEKFFRHFAIEGGSTNGGVTIAQTLQRAAIRTNRGAITFKS